MSCQQASRLITPTTTTPSALATSSETPITPPEDPYVFTETAPTTPPPILFNTQKSRSRLLETTQQQQGATTASATVAAVEASATAVTSTASAPATATATAAATTTNKSQTQIHTKVALASVALNGNAKKSLCSPPAAQQQPQEQQKPSTTTATAVQAATAALASGVDTPVAGGNGLKTVAGSPLPKNKQISPKLQQQKNGARSVKQPTHQQQQLQQQKRIIETLAVPVVAPLPPQQSLTFPLLQHTPSLWQTPLLLDTAGSAAVVSPPTSPASLPSPTRTPPPPAMAAAVAATGSAPAPPTVTTATLLGTAALGLLSPVLLLPSAEPLPPSKFHSTTLAQHLQKVECLKKPKKPTLKPLTMDAAKTVHTVNVIATQSPAPPPPPISSLLSLSLSPPLTSALQPHSDTELNEIPVNVIYRKPQTHPTPYDITPEESGEESSDIVSKTLKKNVKRAPVGVVAAAVTPKPRRGKSSPPPLVTTQQQALITVRSMGGVIGISPTSSTTSIAPGGGAAIKPRSASVETTKTSDTMPSSAPFQIANQENLHLSELSQTQPQVQRQTTTPTPSRKKATGKRKQTPVVGCSGSVARGKYINSNSNSNSNSSCSNSSSPTGQPKRSRKSSQSWAVNDENATDTVDAAAASIVARLGSSSISPQSHIRAVAVVKIFRSHMDCDTSALSEEAVLPYCLQQHWFEDFSLPACVGQQPKLSREERIGRYKSLLQHQAHQMLQTRSLQKLPMHAARRRLLCVDELVRKYRLQAGERSTFKSCSVHECRNAALEMASFCMQHIINNDTQHIFLPCIARKCDGTPCLKPVFDVRLDFPLCPDHRNTYELPLRALGSSGSSSASNTSGAIVGSEGITCHTLNLFSRDFNHQQMLLQHPKVQVERIPQMQATSAATAAITAPVAISVPVPSPSPMRKRKCIATMTTEPLSSAAHVPIGGARAQKRVKKVAMMIDNTNNSHQQSQSQSQLQSQQHHKSATAPVSASASAPPPLSSVLQRTSSVTSLESIASNSHSTSGSLGPVTANNCSIGLAPPALAPLSGGVGVGVGGGGVGGFATATHDVMSFGGGGASSAVDLKVHEIDQIVAQFTMAAAANSNNNLNTNMFNNIYNNNSNHSSSSNNNNNSLSINNNNNNNSSIKNYPHLSNTNLNILNANSNSNLTSSGLGSSSSLPSTDDLLTQDMLSICENSSAYASSEDTGLGGGISETELMVGGGSGVSGGSGGGGGCVAHDADDIELGDAHLLEEHDLANVLSTLPVDAFNELFDAVQQGDCDKMDRELELAEKDLRSLEDLLDVSDMDIVTSVLRSSDTSGIDAASLFMDNANVAGGGGGGGSGSGSGGNGSGNGSNAHGTPIDVRGLVQT